MAPWCRALAVPKHLRADATGNAGLAIALPWLQHQLPGSVCEGTGTGELGPPRELRDVQQVPLHCHSRGVPCGDMLGTRCQVPSIAPQCLLGAASSGPDHERSSSPSSGCSAWTLKLHWTWPRRCQHRETQSCHCQQWGQASVPTRNRARWQERAGICLEGTGKGTELPGP